MKINYLNVRWHILLELVYLPSLPQTLLLFSIWPLIFWSHSLAIFQKMKDFLSIDFTWKTFWYLFSCTGHVLIKIYKKRFRTFNYRVQSCIYIRFLSNYRNLDTFHLFTKEITFLIILSICIQFKCLIKTQFFMVLFKILIPFKSI